MRTNGEIRKLFDVIAKERQLSAGTAYRYRRWIRKFLQYHEGLALDETELEDVEDFIGSLDGLSLSSQRQARNALDFLFKYVVQKNLLVSLIRPKYTGWLKKYWRNWR